MKKSTLRWISLLLSILSAGCSYNPQTPATRWLKLKDIPIAKGHELTLCIDFGCAKNKGYTFTAIDLQNIRATFQPPAETPFDERKRISQVIGLMEQQAGAAIGTLHDQPENNFSVLPNTHQIDCVAESLNTTQYLLLLEREQLLRFHRTGSNIHRGLFTLNIPHNSATIIDVNSEQAFAVDSWFGHNGDPAWVTPIERWLTGASPEQPHR